MISLLLYICSFVAHAASFDPDLNWRTIQTDHFNIHFHQGEEQLAEEFSSMVETVHDTMTKEIGWRPYRRTDVVLIDRTDSANGYATTIPYNTIVIYVTAPEDDSTLSLYEDWSTGIFLHEYTHILHMDANHGIVRAARWVVGRISSTNQVSPLWMVEGFATFQETRQTPGGRGRSRTVDMIKRAAVVHDTFPPLGNLDGLQPQLPAGNIRYLFGEDFISYITSVSHDDAFTDWIHTYGASLPYLMPYKKVFGARLSTLYNGWKTTFTQRYRDQLDSIESVGIREGKPVSDPEASCSAPTWSPNGEHLLYSCSNLRTGSSLWLADAMGEHPSLLKQDYGASNFAWRPDSQAFAFAATHVVNRFNTWSDLYLMNIDKKSIKALTNGARARDPEFSPDGSKLLMVTNKVQNNQLEVLTVDQSRTPLTNKTDHTQYSTPRYAPDGKTLAVSIWANGQRDLWLTDPSGTPIRQLTNDTAIDRDPAWSADGKWLTFVSDRDDIPNVYALEVSSGRLYQVTNVKTGAVKPSMHPDGTKLAYQRYDKMGWRVMVMPFSRESFIEAGELYQVMQPSPQQSPPAPQVDLSNEWDDAPLRVTNEDGSENGRNPTPLSLLDGIDTFDQVEVDDAYGKEKAYPFTITPKRYNPLSSLVPSLWVPIVQYTPYAPTTLTQLPLSFVASALTFGTDPLRYFSWQAVGNYRNDADMVGGSVALTYNRLLPVFTLSAYRTGVPYNRYTVDPNDDTLALTASDLYWEDRRAAALTISFPRTHKTTIFAKFAMTTRHPHLEIPDDTVLSLLPATGRFGTIQGGWRYSWGRPTAYAISPEDARMVSVIGGLLHPNLGSEVFTGDGTAAGATQIQLTAEIKEFIVNPWLPNHVLAMRAAGGMTAGSTDYLGYYQLGGAYGDSMATVTPDEFRMLRGYNLGADVGDRYWLSSVEYRLPIMRFDRGVDWLPLFFGHSSGAVFVDAGNAFGSDIPINDAFNEPLVGVGGEIILAGAVGWWSGWKTRLGYALALTEPDIASSANGTFYAQVGSSF